MPELAAEPRTEAHVQLLGVVAITGLFADHVAPLGSAPKLVAAGVDNDTPSWAATSPRSAAG